jgi:DNA-binding SARP family transcriptional activator/nucleoid-associated protein YgaU
VTGVLRGVRRCAAAALVVAGAAAVLAVLAAGLPWLMWHVTGWPLPRHIPSLAALKAGLTTRESGRFILDVITCAGWACWAAFIADVLLEAAWQIRHLPELARDRAGARRTGRLRERAAGLNPPRALAALLIGGVLLGLLAAVRGTGGALTGPAAPRMPVSLTAAVHAAAPPAPPGQAARRSHGGTLNQPAPPGEVPAGASPRVPDPGAPDSVRPVPAGIAPPAVMTLTAGQQHAPAGASYTVKEGDNLWDIAAAHLGDGEKWHEIYALNEGRPQPGGQELTDPGLIEPGWTLRLPPAPGHQPGPARTRAPQPASTPRPASPPPHHPQDTHPPQLAPAGHHQEHGAPGISLPSGGLAGAGLAAAVAAALMMAGVHRRRRYRPGRTLTSRLDPAGPSVPPSIAVLRRAAHPPPPSAATADPDDADAYFTEEDPGPAGTLPRAASPGSVLRVAARGAATTAGPPGPAAVMPVPPGWPEPPGVIALGVRDGSEASADIAASGGLGLTGPGAPAAARAILAGLLARAVPGQPGGPAEVIVPAADAAILLPGWHRDDISGTGLPGLTVTPTLDAALDQAEALIVRRARMSGSQDTGDDPQDSSPALPAAALIASPSRAATQRLRAVLESGRRTGVAGILLGDWPPGTTCQVAADGTITSTDSAMDGIRLFNLGTADTTAVISLLREACGTPAGEYYPAPVPGGPPPSWPTSETAPAPSPAAGGLPLPAHGTHGSDAATAPVGGGASPGPHTAQSPPLPASAASGAPPGASGPAQPARAEPRPAGDAGRPQQNGSTPDAPARRIIRVEILGPLRITARGQEIRGGLRKARELLAFLVVHPDGVSGEAISEALWPGSAPGRSASQRNLALRKLRDMLRAAAGLTEPMLVTLTAERYRLDPAFITTDVAGFQAALEAARDAADDPARLAACQDAAALYRGPLADGAGYDWAEPYAEAARRRALDAWTRIAELLEPGDPDQALAALEIALGHDPFNEYLYQRIMRLQAAAGRPDAVRRTLRLLEKRLTEIGVTPGSQTRQAAAALLGMPGPSPRAAASPQPPAAPRPAPAARQRPPGRHPAR